MISDRLNSDVAAFVLRYITLLDAMRGVLFGILNDALPTSALARDRLNSRLWALINDYYAQEGRRVEDLTIRIAQIAISDALQEVGKRQHETRRDALLLDFARESANDVQVAMLAQAQRDARSASKYLRDYTMDVDRLLASTNYKYASALIAVAQRKGSPGFTFMDRAGKSWKSERFIEVLMRSHLFSVYNDSFLYTLSWFGVTAAHVRNSGGNSDGVKFSIDGQDKTLPTYDSLKKTVFHPNSSAIVKK